MCRAHELETMAAAERTRERRGSWTSRERLRIWSGRAGQSGLCLVTATHLTAAVFINDAEAGLLPSFDVWLEKLASSEPVNLSRHNLPDENGADPHLERQLLGREVVVAITQGQLDLGPWEQIFYGEFDGRRRKRVLVKIIGE